MIVAIAVLAVAVVAAAVCAFFVFGGGNGGFSDAEDAINAYIDATLDYDARATMELIPDEYLDNFFEDKDEYNEWLEEFEQELESFIAFVEEEGIEYEQDCEIDDYEELDDDALEELNDSLGKYLDEEIKEAREYTLNFHSVVNGNESSSSLTVIAFKYGSGWFIDPSYITSDLI